MVLSSKVVETVNLLRDHFVIADVFPQAVEAGLPAPGQGTPGEFLNKYFTLMDWTTYTPPFSWPVEYQQNELLGSHLSLLTARRDALSYLAGVMNADAAKVRISCLRLGSSTLAG